MNNNTYYYGTGKRKSSIARVFIKKGEGIITVNNKIINKYFKRNTKSMIAIQPLLITEKTKSFDIKINVKGGGENGQAEAIRHGISKALTNFNILLKKKLSQAGFITRDARKVERKKVGLHKARKAKQFSKR